MLHPCLLWSTPNKRLIIENGDVTPILPRMYVVDQNNTVLQEILNENELLKIIEIKYYLQFTLNFIMPKILCNYR